MSACSAQRERKEARVTPGNSCTQSQAKLKRCTGMQRTEAPAHGWSDTVPDAMVGSLAPILPLPGTFDGQLAPIVAPQAEASSLVLSVFVSQRPLLELLPVFEAMQFLDVEDSCGGTDVHVSSFGSWFQDRGTIGRGT
jgi:hypothetical protein